MAGVPMKGEMESVGRSLSSWHAQLEGLLWSVALLGGLWIFGLSDIFMQFEKPGRVISWLILLALAGLAVWRIRRALTQPRTVLGVAAVVERAFPQLDNHLINYIQFGMASDGDAFKMAYVRRGVPEWRQVDVRQMKNRKAHLRANLALVGAVVLMALPGALAGRTWLVSLWRIVNPFSNVPPVSLTHIVGVDPGSTSVLQGKPVIFTCRVQGRRGHRVWLDVKPADNEKSTYDLGRINSGDIEEFPYRLSKVTTDVEYRFRAGDAPFPKWYKIQARPPLAFTTIELKVAPPSYTRLDTRTFDAQGDTINIPQGSRVDVTALCNLPVTNATLLLRDETIALTLQDEGKSARGAFVVKDGASFRITVGNEYGERIDSVVNFQLLPDREPTLTIVKPEGRTLLPPNAAPSIEFTVEDDYGLAEVWVERVPPGSTKQTLGEMLDKWSTPERVFTRGWKSTTLKMDNNDALVFRIVARDNCPFADRRTQSSAVVFDGANVTNAVGKEAAQMAAAVQTLGKIVELQRANLQDTGKLRDALVASQPDQWARLADVQQEVRQLTGKLIDSPLNLLGSMTLPVRKLYMQEMLEAVARLKETGGAAALDRADLADKSTRLQEAILRQLTFAEAATEKSKQQKKISGLVAMLETLIKDQTKILTTTRDYIKKAAPVGKPLVDQQDRAAAAVAAFAQACRDEAMVLATSDPKFAETMTAVVAQCEDQQVRNDMLKAAEQLDENAPAQAVPLEENALAKLKALSELMNQWQVASAEERLADVMEVFNETRAKLDKLAQLEGKVIEAMLQTEKQKDRQDKAGDLFEDEAKQLRENMEDALLQIPVDLQIFPELSVANELVEDVVSVFEEVKQLEGSEKWGADKVSEFDVLKPESFLEQMKKAADRMDSTEMWLAEKPDVFQVNTEAFEKEEMTKKMSLGALSAAAEDLVGDLLKESEELKNAAEDAATNHSLPDAPPPGWEVMEGDIESFGAQGKSGNQMPDHKQQGGRGNIGRQGMSNGEAAASSGTIGEGDPNMEERITPEPLQSGQIQADGDADTKATGGGKLGSGSADGVGMTGGGQERRMDSTAGGSAEGLQALMAKTDALHVKASLLNLRTDSIAAASHHVRQAADAVAAGLPISQVKEYQNRAVAALKKAQTELSSGVSDTIETEDQSQPLRDVMDGGADTVPSNYKDLVAEYYKSLNESF